MAFKSPFQWGFEQKLAKPAFAFSDTSRNRTNKTGQIRKYRSRLARALGRFWATSVQRLSYLRINATFFCRELALMRSWGARSLCFREPFTRWKYGIDSRLIVLIGSCFWGNLILKISFMRMSENYRDIIGWHSIKSGTAWILRFVCCLIFRFSNNVYYICLSNRIF